MPFSIGLGPDGKRTTHASSQTLCKAHHGCGNASLSQLELAPEKTEADGEEALHQEDVIRRDSKLNVLPKLKRVSQRDDGGVTGCAELAGKAFAS